MDVFFSYRQTAHDPPEEYFAGVLEPHLETPDRVTRVFDYLLKDVRFKVREPRSTGKWVGPFMTVHDPIYLAILK